MFEFYPPISLIFPCLRWVPLTPVTLSISEQEVTLSDSNLFCKRVFINGLIPYTRIFSSVKPSVPIRQMRICTWFLSFPPSWNSRPTALLLRKDCPFLSLFNAVFAFAPPFVKTPFLVMSVLPVHGHK